MMSEKRFQHMRVVDNVACIYDSKTDDVLKINDIINKLNEFNEQLQILKEEIETLKQKEEVSHYKKIIDMIKLVQNQGDDDE